MRGYFVESLDPRSFARELGLRVGFVKDNEALSAAVGTVRGLHSQCDLTAQGKLVRAIKGAIFDVAVNIRTGSLTFGRHQRLAVDADLLVLVIEWDAFRALDLDRSKGLMRMLVLVDLRNAKSAGSHRVLPLERRTSVQFSEARIECTRLEM